MILNKEFFNCANINVEGEEDKNYILEYSLTKSHHPFKTGNINYICYGVRVDLKDENECTIETQEMNDIFSSKEKAIEFLELLYVEKVTPCTLSDVVKDTLINALS